MNTESKRSQQPKLWDGSSTLLFIPAILLVGVLLWALLLGPKPPSAGEIAHAIVAEQSATEADGTNDASLSSGGLLFVPETQSCVATGTITTVRQFGKDNNSLPHDASSDDIARAEATFKTNEGREIIVRAMHNFNLKNGKDFTLEFFCDPGSISPRPAEEDTGQILVLRAVVAQPE